MTLKADLILIVNGIILLLGLLVLRLDWQGHRSDVARVGELRTELASRGSSDEANADLRRRVEALRQEARRLVGEADRCRQDLAETQKQNEALRQDLNKAVTRVRELSGDPFGL